MMPTEPMTLATDYVLAALGAWCGFGLRRRAGGLRGLGGWWALALWAMGAAALLGGTYHGFAELLPAPLLTLLWKMTMLAVGIASGCLALAAVGLFVGPRGWSLWLGAIVLKLALYAVWVVAFDDSFLWAVLDYSLAMGLALVVHSARAWGGAAWAWWVVAGILVSFAGAAIQRAGWSLHRHFNHNDLYHVVQMVGLVMLYRGASRARSWPRRSAEPTVQ